MKFSKAMLLTAIFFLIAFEASAGNSFFDKFTLTKSQEKPAWHNEKLITCDVCNSITYDNVKSFIKAYDIEKEKRKASEKDEAAGRELMESYTMASLLVNRSQLCMAQALQLKEVTQDLLKEKKILLSGTSLSKKEIKKHREYSKAASQKIVSATEKTKKLSSEQRSNFALGTATYLTGSYMTQRAAKDIIEYVDAVSDKVAKDNKTLKDSDAKSILEKGTDLFNISSAAKAIATLRNLSAGIDDHLLNLTTTSKSIYKYSQSQKLDLPADVSQTVTF